MMKRIEISSLVDMLYDMRDGFKDVLMHSYNNKDFKSELMNIVSTAQMMDEFHKTRKQEMKNEELNEEEVKLLGI